MTTRHQACMRVEVEQAVAFGRSIDWIYDRLGVEPVFLDAVLRGMDAAARHDDNAFDLTLRPSPAVDHKGNVLRPHGTHAAFNRHKIRDEEPCEACVDAERQYQAARHQRTHRQSSRSSDGSEAS